MEIQTRPLQGPWPKPFTRPRKASPFKSSFEQSRRLLEAELRHLDAGAVMIQAAFRESDISATTGFPRGDRTPEHPGIIVAADTRHGPLKWLCDACTRWQHNVHAIALTLGRLRLADLYGVTGRGEQYHGWKMLPGPITTDAPVMSIDAAARTLSTLSQLWTAAQILGDRKAFEMANRRAHLALHPDAGTHNPLQWAELQEASKLLNNLHNRR